MITVLKGSKFNKQNEFVKESVKCGFAIRLIVFTTIFHGSRRKLKLTNIKLYMTKRKKTESSNVPQQVYKDNYPCNLSRIQVLGQF